MKPSSKDKDTSAPNLAPAVPPQGAAGHSLHYRLLFGVAKNKRALWSAIAGVAVVAVVVLSVILFTDISLESLTAAIDRLNPIAVVPAMAILPAFGFPIVVVYLIAGARFGPLLGGAVVAFATAMHLLLAYGVTKTFLRRPLERFLEKRHLHFPEIPADEHVPVALIAALVPGLPYVVRNYALALAGVRMRVSFWVCLPIYVARSYVTILLGDMGADPDGKKLLILGGVEVLKVAICAYVIWRLREHHRKFHGADANAHAPGAVAPPTAAAR